MAGNKDDGTVSLNFLQKLGYTLLVIVVLGLAISEAVLYIGGAILVLRELLF